MNEIEKLTKAKEAAEYQLELMRQNSCFNSELAEQRRKTIIALAAALALSLVENVVFIICALFQ